MKTVDIEALDWLECGHCDGHVAREGADVYHSHPPCPCYLKLMEQYGGKLEHVKDSSLN